MEDMDLLCVANTNFLLYALCITVLVYLERRTQSILWILWLLQFWDMLLRKRI